MAETTPGRTPFLSAEKAADVRERFGTPCYVYAQPARSRAPRPWHSCAVRVHVTLRDESESEPGHPHTFRNLGLHIDASSDFEVERASRRFHT